MNKHNIDPQDRQEMGYYVDQQFEESNNKTMRESEVYGSDNYDNLSIEEGDSSNVSTNTSNKKRKRYHRHNPQQIQELENLFKKCSHPDEKQRLEIARRLGLESKQVMFWFQNRRTRLKTHMERRENVALKQGYDKLEVENIAMKDALKNPKCQTCGGPSLLGELSMDRHHLKVETARLKDELSRVCAISEWFLGKPITELIAPFPIPMKVSPMGHNFEQGASSNSTLSTSINHSVSAKYEKTMYIKAALTAMDELLIMAQTDSPLWFKALDDGKELLNNEVYVNKFFGFMGMKPSGFITDALRETGSVFITSMDLVDAMMSPKQWQELFPCMISKAATVEVLCNGTGGTRDGELQLMNVEFIFPSPLVPCRQEKILRFCKKHSKGMWAMVDISVHMIQERTFSESSDKYMRLPSGCVIQDVANGYSMVTWIEHLIYDETYIHQLYRPLLRSGMAFGARRWLATLQRERDCTAIFMSARIYPDEATIIITQEGRKSILKLTRRICNNLCSGLCGSSAHPWEKQQVGGMAADVCILSRVSVDDPGEPSGVVISASTSIWMPLPRNRLFNFLRDEKLRGKWDILANGGPMEVLTRLSKSHDGNNCVTLLCPPAAPDMESNMLILQESWLDQTTSFIAYAPVDSSSMDSVLRGGDSDYLALLPSGFIISDAPILPNGVTITDNCANEYEGASAMTLGIQILLSSLPTAKLTMESINTINNLLSSTIQKIRESLGIH